MIIFHRKAIIYMRKECSSPFVELIRSNATNFNVRRVRMLSLVPESFKLRHVAYSRSGATWF